jgi:putative transposase|tara:strand:+ start:19015 stop:19290 length:276 start_codon:yes stop_codon:yes gene_type:complete
MTRKKSNIYSEVKIFEILKEYKYGVNVLEICTKHGISKSTLYKWRNKYQDMELSDIQRLKSLTEENRRLREICANLNLDNLILKEALEKNF